MLSAQLWGSVFRALGWLVLRALTRDRYPKSRWLSGSPGKARVNALGMAVFCLTPMATPARFVAQAQPAPLPTAEAATLAFAR